MSAALSLTFALPASLTSGFSEATPTDLIQIRIPKDGQGGEKEQKDTLLVGCEDGSLFLFHSTISTGSTLPSPPAITEVSPISPLLSGRQKPRRPSSPHSLSPTSPRSSHSPFHVPKPRAVSSVSTELAEAPKNYVDFDDEQEKMKNMLKRKGVKDKTVMDSLMPGVEKAVSPDKCAESGSAKEGGVLHRASTPLSSSSSTHSLSRPSSVLNMPSVVVSDSQETTWHLLCQTIPHRRARRSPVVSLKAVPLQPLALGLHASG